MKKFLLKFLLLAAAALSVQAASLPEWIKPNLSAELGSWAGEPAIVLHEAHLARFTTADHMIETRHVLVRVNAIRGRKHASFAKIYNPGNEKVLSASAWVIGPDGKVQKTYKRSDFSEAFASDASITWSNERILSIDLGRIVELGGCVAFEVQIESIDPITEIAHFIDKHLPCVKSTLEVTPPANVSLQWFSTLENQIAPTAGAAPGSLSWTIDRIDKKLDDTPINFIPKTRAIVVRCTRPAGSEMDQSSWPSLVKGISSLLAPAIKPTDPIRAKALELTKGKADRWSRIRALCEFAQRDIRYIQITLDTDYLAGCRPHPATEVLKNRYGDCKDKAALLVSLLESIGERAYMIIVNSGNPIAVSENWPALHWFNHAIVGIVADADTPATWPISNADPFGKIVIFDPTDSVTPLGVLSSGDQGGFGMLVAEKDGGLIKLPIETPDLNTNLRQISATLDENCALQTHVNTVISGSDGSDSYRMRLHIGDVDFGRFLEQRLHDSISSINNFTWTDSWDSTNSRHTIERHFNTASYAMPLGNNQIIVQPGILSMDMKQPKLNQLDGHVDFRAKQTVQTTTLNLPANITVTDLPKPSKGEEKFLSWYIRCTNEEGNLVYRATIIEKAVIADFSLYEELRLERQKLNEILRRPVILNIVRTQADPGSTAK